MSRNAYEIRLETLRLARDILSENYSMAHDQYRDALKHVSKKDEGGDDLSYAEAPDGAAPPKGYTTDDVLQKARELYAFVNEDTKAA